MTLEPDVAAAIDSVRRGRHIGVSAVVNELIRAGLREAPAAPVPFLQRTSRMGALTDVANVADVLDEPNTR